MRKCPKCGRWFDEQPALSRIDNKTEICSVCGEREALDAFTAYVNETDSQRDYIQDLEEENENLSEQIRIMVSEDEI